MIRTSFSRSLALAVTLTTALLSACADDGVPSHEGPAQTEPTGPTGSVGFQLQTGGVSITSISYTISGNGLMKTGTINVPGDGATFSGLIGGIPTGNGYTLALTAVGSNGATCSAQTMFNITTGATTTVGLRLQCRLPPRTGSVMINGSVNICPRIDGIDALPGSAVLGGTIALSGVASDSDAMPAALTFSWQSGAGSIVSASAAAATLICGVAGTSLVTLTVSDGDCTDTLSVSVTCTAPPDGGVAPDAAPDTAPVLPVIKVNEIESSQGVPGDWVELYNAGAAAADVSGWKFKDGDDSHAFYVFPAGTTIAAGGYLVLEESQFGFGLGTNDSARIFDPAGALVDSHTWGPHATPTTYGRCPNGTGAFVTTASVTKGAANDCPAVDAGTPDTAPVVDTAPPVDTAAPVDTAPADTAPVDATPIVVESWPGQNAVAEADTLNQFGDNLSGLTYEPALGASPAVLWAVLNSPSLVYRLVWNGSTFAFDTNDGWGAGKAIKYVGGTGNPDSESLTKPVWGEPFVYVSSERNNDASSVSRLVILRVDGSTPGAVLNTTNEWNVTADIPAVGPNLGLEAITHVPDTYLVAGGFRDELLNAPYNPANYPNHGTGLFIVGVEATGTLYAYALDHVGGGFSRIATIASGFPAVMGLEFDRETGALWAACDNTCAGKQNVLGIVGGRFVVRRSFGRPSTLPDSNNEGVAFGTESECTGGFKRFFWSDDSHFGGHALRIDSIPCGPLF